MPPIPKYTKEEITLIAFNMVKEKGYDMLTARDLAKKLGTSTRPIFTAFENMDALKKEIIYKSAELFKKYKKHSQSNPQQTIITKRGNKHHDFIQNRIMQLLQKVQKGKLPVHMPPHFIQNLLLCLL